MTPLSKPKRKPPSAATAEIAMTYNRLLFTLSRSFRERTGQRQINCLPNESLFAWPENSGQEVRFGPLEMAANYPLQNESVPSKIRTLNEALEQLVEHHTGSVGD